MGQRSQEEQEGRSVAVMVERSAEGQGEDEEKRQEKQWLCDVIEA